MKAPARRLGRGLGAFLDFGEPDEDGAARVERVIAAADAPSVLETSANGPPPKPAPRAAVPKPVPPPPARVDPPAAPPAAAPPVPKPTAPAADDAAFIDDVVVGLTFPDVELE